MASTSSSAAGSSEETKFDADGPHKVPMEPAPAAGGSGSMKTAVFGDYDYTAELVTFYAKDEALPIFLSAIMGLQHAFAMVGGLITPPYVIFRFSVDFLDTELQQYAISAALITSGLCTLVNVMQIPIPFTERIFGRSLVIGSGVLSVMGVSFTFLPVFESSMSQMKNDGYSGIEAYGKMLGTVMVCALLEVFLSIVSTKTLKKVFPPFITGITVFLIGASLIGTGMKYWGGGVVCAEMGWKEHDQAVAAGVNPIPGPACVNGEVVLGYGSPEFLGLGFVVLCGLVLIEIFGSPFMKNANVVIALCFGYLIAAVTNYNGLDYVDSSKIQDAEAITFLWVETFPIGFYGPAVLPLLIAFLVTTIESVGDITATYEASDLSIETIEYEKSVQGGLLADALSSIFSSLATSMPNTTFSQNNGVISMTRCASTRAGIACGIWLICMGVLGKVAGIITNAVLGGMTIFLFACVAVSGIKVISQADLSSRRLRFILTMSLAVGLGVTIWPYAFADMRASPYSANFWPCDDCSDAMKGFRNGVSIFLSTGYCIGSVIAIFLNTILPADAAVVTSGGVAYTKTNGLASGALSMATAGSPGPEEIEGI